MMPAAENSVDPRLPSLDSLFPIGLLDAESSRGGENALRAIRILEKVLVECSTEKALAARHALLQTFVRFEDHATSTVTARVLGSDNYLRAYAAALMPPWYGEALALLNDEEVETFLKIYFSAHECWGHAEGAIMLVRSMVASCIHQDAKVIVPDLVGEDREIPDNLRSHLGNTTQYSQLGNDFVLGKRFVARPLTYKIVVGPISLHSLEKLQRDGWAEGTLAAAKLQRLVEFAEPFYLKASIHFILVRVGFILGSANLGKDKLGFVETNVDVNVGVLVGNG